MVQLADHLVSNLVLAVLLINLLHELLELLKLLGSLVYTKHRPSYNVLELRDCFLDRGIGPRILAPKQQLSFKHLAVQTSLVFEPI